ncbi:ROK family protein [Amycolatopsis thermoflava]|uniref:ROK family protein n=1 Tax=Amycolatopsis thermoflava TaxID=84480 RepID=UPI00364C980A
MGPDVGGRSVGENGRLPHNVDGAAADIGHIRVPELPEALCRCGSHDCLQAVASTGAIASRLGLSEGDLLASVIRGEANTVTVVLLSPRGIADHTRPLDSPMPLGL